MIPRTKTALTPVDEALGILMSHAALKQGSESIPLFDSLGRILAQDQQAGVTVPPADNSAMDGYAVNTADLNKRGETRLRVDQRIAAGEVGRPLCAAGVARIFTGAPTPEGSDAVVMQEQCRLEGDYVWLPEGVRCGQNIRKQGEDFCTGDILLRRGVKMRPQELGLLASMGAAKVSVTKKIKVMLFSTGDELVEPGHPLESGQIYNSNRYMLAGLITNMGLQCIDGGILPDNYQATERALKNAATQADIVISTGGVSVGEEDHVKDALENIGELNLWKLAIKPGKPLAFGSLHHETSKTPFFGLPGNPSASFVTFCILVRPFLLKMSGAEAFQPLQSEGFAQFERKEPGSRREYLRAKMIRDDNNHSQITIYDNQSSGMLSAASWANGFAIIEVGKTVAQGDLIPFISYGELL